MNSIIVSEVSLYYFIINLIYWVLLLSDASSQMEISYYVSWRLHYMGKECNSTTVANGNLLIGDELSDLECQYGCTDLIISKMPYICTDFSTGDEWLLGGHHITHTFNNISDNNTVTVGTVSGNWNRKVGKGWNISTTFSLLTRGDTGKINSSPRVVPTFNLLLQQGCNYTIPLSVSDPDNDVIRCRWAVKNECRTICKKFRGALLDSISCTITYSANYRIGLRAVAMMIEDFAPGSPNHPLSSVALQFLALVFKSNQPCSSSYIECFKFPSIITHPSDEIVIWRQHETFNVTLTCMANETSSYHWEKESGDIPITSIGVHTNTITLINVQPEDSGNYRCVAFVCSTSNRSFSNYATVTVVQIPVLVTHPSSQHINLTQNATFTCDATGYNVSYQWTIGSGSFPNKVIGINSNTLVIPDVRSSDDNAYTCVASNEGGNATSKQAKLIVTGLPAVIAMPHNQTVEITHTGRFIIKVEGVGPFNYQWKRGIHSLKNQVYSTFVINNVSAKDQNYYRCNVTNNYGDSVLSNRVFLQVTINLPVIIRNPINTSLSLKTNFTNVSLICEANGGSIYYWERQHGSIPSTAIGVNTSTLTLSNLQLKDAGYYRCIAINASGSTKSKYAKLILTVSSSTIVTQPTDTSAAAPFSGVFTCSVEGYGYHNILWYKQSDTLPYKHKIKEMTSQGVATSILIIPNVTKEDVGEYYCQVWANNIGVRSITANLYYSGTPLKPTVAVLPARLVKLRVNNYNLQMRCLPYDNKFSYKWERKNMQLPLNAQSVNSEHLVIFNVRPEDSGEYRCTMSNYTGQIASDYVLVTVKVALPTITRQPRSAVTEVYDDAIFECMARSYGNVSITWRRLNSELPKIANITRFESLNEIRSVLRIQKSIGYYKGYYYCIIENIAGIVNSSFAYCNITVPCPQMIMLPEPVVVRPSATVTFSCLAWSYGGLVYKWNRNSSSTLPPNTTVSFQEKPFPADTICFTTVCTLTIVNVHVKDRGYYCCIATNECGKSKECAWLEIDTSPVITVHPKSQAFKDKQKNISTLWIVATGVEPIYYQWQKYDPFNNIWTPPSSRAENTTSPNLTFSVITEEDEGLYRCNASNDDGSVVSDPATVTVYGSPNITYYSNGIVAFEGQKVYLTCNATNDEDATDPVQISWYNGTQRLKSTENLVTIYNKFDKSTDQICSILVIDSVAHYDDGEYTCQAFNNPLCYTEDKIILTVEYAPRIAIDPAQSPYTVNVGERLILYCTAEGFPIPTIQWYKNNVPVLQKPPQSYLAASTNTPGTTVYTCEGKNNAGNMKNTANANITVIVKKISKCPAILDPDNGKVFIISDGEVAIFTCYNGFVTVGNSQLQCIDGKWNSPPPKCQIS